MAENNTEGSESANSKKENNEGWFNSWLSAAKNKSTEVLEFVKKDLEEFGTAVKNEASSVVSSAGSVMEKTLSLESPDSTVNSVKRSFSTFLGQMNTVLNPSPDDEDTEILIIENSETHSLNRLQKALYELQKNPETYLCDPEPQIRKQYECWLEILEPDQLSDDRIAKFVNSSEVLKKQYAKLVPDIMDHQLFWKRYLFKKALLEDEIARQELLEKREQKAPEKEEPVAEEEEEEFVERQKQEKLKWDNADVELTEEEQIALLEQYEHEQKQKSPKSSVKKAAMNSGDKKVKGYKQFNGLRIVNGTSAKKGEFPYMVSLRTWGPDYTEIHWCGGSIISEIFILTAGHCLDEQLIFARIAQIELDDFSENHTYSVTIRKVYLYPYYYKDLNSVNDLALVELVTPLVFDSSVQPIKLPEFNTTVPILEEASIIGWGMVNESLREPSPILQKADVTIFPDFYCEYFLGADYLVDQMLCAGDLLNTRGHCSGDSGGPLVVDGIQWGIVSWSIKPCISAPGVYTSLANSTYRSWIRDITGV
ncbi:hyaluronan-binding protein 2-like isoform X2 [Anthonomus grandis grandis]|uniref:hyaluronan-binding protein 2-like isoform X2 n=1 Tax=Anthonomus grandis grandis TaxID=2921223 RepID=UPI002165B182|nr:hyaluronan-binding protein 2-like isoform X2 [Anthonomus grandis grandis]